MAAQKIGAIEWYRVPVPREELKRLTARSDAAALVQTVGFLATAAATGAASWIAWAAAAAGTFPVWGVALLVFLHGTVWAFILNGFHELVHYTVFKTRRLGTFFLYLYSFLGWFDPVFFRASHTRHHLYTLHPPKDREVQLPIRMRLWNFLRVAIVDPLGPYHRARGFFRTAIGRYNGDWQREIIEEDGPKTKRALVNFSRFLLIGHAVVIAVAVATQTWQLIVLVTLAPYYGRWLHFLCNETQHIGLVDNVPDFRLCCRTFTVNPIVRFLYWNMNYHTEHHMYAAVPCYRLHRLHKVVRHELPAWPHGLIATWRHIVGILKRQEAEPGYQFIPELPGPPEQPGPPGEPGPGPRPNSLAT
jgi:fatty acid desaturase